MFSSIKLKSLKGGDYLSEEIKKITSPSGLIEICEMPEEELAGRVRIKMSALEIVPDNSSCNENGISWLEEHINNNIKSTIGMPYVVSWLSEEDQIPSDHGTMSFDNDGNVQFEGVSVGSVQECYIQEVEINGEIKKLLMTEGYLYCQRYSKFVEWLKNEIQNGTVFGSIEINGKGKSKTIEYLDGSTNEDGTPKKFRVPVNFDFSGLSILYLTEPADKLSQVFEVNSKQDDLDINETIEKEGNNNLSIKGNQLIELNELSYDDIACLIEREFNRKIREDSSFSDVYFRIHKFYPTNSTFVMTSYWDRTGEYYRSSYTVENSKVIIGEIIKVEEDWKPVDGGNAVEINNSLINIFNKFKEEKNVDEKVVLELNTKLEEKTNEINTLNKDIESKTTEINTLTEKVTGLDAKVTELNTTIVEVNKLVEAEKTEKEALTVEVNSLREFKTTQETESKKVEVNTYFETEIKKNGFEEAELNTLKTFVDNADLEGLKKAEAELCAKKFKELIANSATDIETNSQSAMFIAIKDKEKKELDGSIPSFFE